MSVSDNNHQESIAIIGMSGRFPGASNIEKFWRNLRDGVESISFFSDGELQSTGASRDDLNNPDYVKARAVLDEIELFDAPFFGYNPREAAIIDPQQRLFLECAWQALEHAGYDPERSEGSIGVYAGMSMSTYLGQIYSNPKAMDSISHIQLILSNDKDHLATRTSYKLNLKGPSVCVQTACSTSLVATHLACQGLLDGECDMALAGGVSISVPQKTGYVYLEGGILSSDGHCRAFDANARGTVAGSGVGVVVLKKLSEALEDGDTVYAVIKGSAINNDGAMKVGYTAPSIEGQAQVIAEALGISRVEPETISYIEAHGTGTALGDPIEIAALDQVFRSSTDRKSFCAIGSVKTNVGHLDAAAGVTSLIKTALALHHKQLPASLNFQQPNPKIDFANSPFFVNTALSRWPEGKTRRAGVSSFGIGGTNAHIVMEEAPEALPGTESRACQMLMQSAKTKSALEQASEDLARYLEENPEVNLSDVAYTLQQGRRGFNHRQVVMCRSVEEAISGLRAGRKDGMRRAFEERRNRAVMMMFSGQGPQYVNMGRGLYQAERVFREEVDRCAEMIERERGWDVREVLYAEEGRVDEASQAINQTEKTQPLILVIEKALVEMWKRWGVKPSGMIGHSLGEYAAAVEAGVMSLEEAIDVVSERGRLMQGLEQGAMVSVAAAEEELTAMMGERLSLAAVNGPSRCVVSGPLPEIEDFKRLLDERNMKYRQLETSHAFHSAMMEPILDQFKKKMEMVKLKPPGIPYISCVSGTWITAGEATDPAYWVRQLRETVHFAKGLKELLKDKDAILFEIGPGQTLEVLARQHPDRTERQAVLSSLPSRRGGKPDLEFALETLARLWLEGVDVDWSAFYEDEHRHRVPLPTYPFERKRYWVERAEVREPILDTSAAAQPHSADSSLQRVEAHSAGYLVKEKEAHMEESTRRRQLNRKDTILAELGMIISELVGVSLAEINAHTPFVEMGVDSLLLIQANQLIQTRLQVKISLVQLLEELKTIDVLADYIDRELPEGALQADIADENTLSTQPPSQLETQQRSLEDLFTSLSGAQDHAEQHTVTAASGQANGLGRVTDQMLDIWSRQIELLRTIRLLGDNTASANAVAAMTGAAEVKKTIPRADQTQPQAAGGARAAASAYVAHQPLMVGSNEGLSPRQQEYVDAFIDRYVGRTIKSKQFTQSYRPFLADNRSSAGFRLLLKEILYPIIGDRSSGAKMWDVDGNEYVDLAMGFGAYLFGHSPSFIFNTITEQLARGMQVGPQSDLAGEAAMLISELTGVERTTFCNSGTEAVMTALRVARAVTGRKKVALFLGNYHGSFDGTLSRAISQNGAHRSVPMAPGVMPGMVEDVMMLEYDNPESLSILGAHAKELAAVLIEPVQSRRPDVQPREFLQQLREITRRNSIALIFDEVITGFRIHPGGAQAWFDVQSDLVIYGKIIGGGMPIGVLAGKAAYMDAIDGGMWKFGDGSYPKVEKTFFAGTFCKHPLAMAAAQAVLKHLKSGGAAIQKDLNERTSGLATNLNEFFERDGIDIRVVNFGSLFRFLISNRIQYPELFFYHLVDRGVYVWEGNTCFLSTAHTDEDIDYVIRAVKESVSALRQGEFLASSPVGTASQKQSAIATMKASQSAADPGSIPPAIDSSAQPGMDDAEGQQQVLTFPLTEAQKQLWVLAQMTDEACRAYNESLSLHMRGPLDLGAMHHALQKLVDRHEALRATFTREGDRQIIHPKMSMAAAVDDFSHLDQGVRELETGKWMVGEARKPFDFVTGPLVRARMAKIDEQYYILVLTIHHIVTDGWSVAILLNELRELYSSEHEGKDCRLRPPAKFSEFASQQQVQQQTQEMAAAEKYWLDRFADSVPVLELPTDRPRSSVQTYNGDRRRYSMGGGSYSELKRLSARQGCTLFMTLLATFELLLHHLSGQDDVVVGMHSAGQVSTGNTNLVGYCLNILPLRSRLAIENTFLEYLALTKESAMQAYNHQIYPLITLVRTLNVKRDPARMPIVSVMFNLDRFAGVVKFSDLDVEVVSNSSEYARFDIFWDVIETETNLVVECDYNSDLFDAETIHYWMALYERFLRAISENPDITIRDLRDLFGEISRRRQITKEEEYKESRRQKLMSFRRGTRAHHN